MGWGGKGKGWGGGGGWGGGWSSPMQKGWGKGKGKGPYKCAPEKKVWIGGFPAVEQTDIELNKALQQHMKQAGDCKNVSIGKAGSGSAAFATAEEAATAIATLNGSTFQGIVIEVDTWTEKDGTAFEPRS